MAFKARQGLARRLQRRRLRFLVLGPRSALVSLLESPRWLLRDYLGCTCSGRLESGARLDRCEGGTQLAALQVLGIALSRDLLTL
jgi:hypothetical protein